MKRMTIEAKLTELSSALVLMRFEMKVASAASRFSLVRSGRSRYPAWHIPFEHFGEIRKPLPSSVSESFGLQFKWSWIRVLQNALDLSGIELIVVHQVEDQDVMPSLA